MNAPAGERVSIDAIADVIQGQSPPGVSYNTAGRGLPFLQGKAEFGAVVPTPVKWCSDPRKVAEPDDVLLSIRAPVGPTNLCDRRSAIGRGLAALRPRNGLPAKYLMYAMRATEGELRAKSTGTTFEAVSGRVVRQHEVWLAPKDERVARVREFEARSSSIDSGEAGLRRTLRRLTAYRAAILDEGWRGFQRRDDEEPHLPPGWSMRSIEDLAASADYGTSEKCGYDFQGPPVVRIPNVVGGRLDLKDLKFAKPGARKVDSELAAGDLLVVRTNGSRDLIGRAAVVDGPMDGVYYHASYLIRFRIPSVKLARWVALMWQAPKMRRVVVDAAATSAGQYNVSLGRLNGLTLPIPPEDELEIQFNRLADALGRVGPLETIIRSDLSRAAGLRSSLLRQTFGGPAEL